MFTQFSGSTASTAPGFASPNQTGCFLDVALVVLDPCSG